MFDENEMEARQRDAEEQEREHSRLYIILNQHVSNSAERQYQQRLVTADTEKERRKCAGAYPSSYSRLMNLWLCGKVDNDCVNQCLEANEADIDSIIATAVTAI